MRKLVMYGVAVAIVALLLGAVTGNRVAKYGYAEELAAAQATSAELTERVETAESQCTQAEAACTEAETQRVECEVQLQILNDENGERAQRATQLLRELSLVFTTGENLEQFDNPGTDEPVAAGRRGPMLEYTVQRKSTCLHGHLNCGACGRRTRKPFLRLVSEM